jgi:hypothetical protein
MTIYNIKRAYFSKPGCYKALKYIAKALATLQRLNVKIFLAHNAGL